MTPDVLVGLLAEPERLRVVAALVLGARTPSQLIDATGLDSAPSVRRCNGSRAVA